MTTARERRQTLGEVTATGVLQSTPQLSQLTYGRATVTETSSPKTACLDGSFWPRAAGRGR